METFCRITNPQQMKLSFLDIPKVSTKNNNSTIILMPSLIVSMWQARKSTMNTTVTKKYLKCKLLQKIHYSGTYLEKS